MMSFSEIETVSKRASKAIGYSWGIAEEIGKSVRILEMFNLPGISTLNQYLKNTWWVMRDSNSRHLRCKRSALPTELITH